MWPFTRKKEKPITLEATLKMGELVVNPTMEQKYRRHVSRIGTINEVLKTLPKDSASYKSFEKEKRRRQLEIELQEIKGGN